MGATKHRASEQFAVGNLEAARVILADIERYGGEESALVVLARTVTAPPKDSEAGPLFRENKSGPEPVSQASKATTKS